MKDKILAMIRKRLPIILVTIGVLLMAYPVIGRIYARYQEEKMLAEWLNSIDVSDFGDADAADPEESYALLQDAFDTEDSGNGGKGTGISDNAGGDGGQTGDGGASAGNGTGQKSSASDLSNQRVLGIIQIPKIKVKDPIVEGVEKSNLKAGIGHVPGTPLPGQPGNCALAGHRNYALKKLFRRLDELENGDEVIIITKTETLRYTVTGKVVVEPDDVSVLQGSKDKSIISMITCTPMYVHSHRLVVFAELVERVPREP
ncbi:MAG TPA: class D sortase [Clostridiales bacterium]|nr:class D sortase [Clostridiales bacterium]HPP35778.1 class D sortase [Clostridiales bacterium]